MTNGDYALLLSLVSFMFYIVLLVWVMTGLKSPKSNTEEGLYSAVHKEIIVTNYLPRKYDLEAIQLDSKSVSQTVLNNLKGIISRYGHTSVSDLRELLGVEANWLDTNYGWYDLSNAKVVKRGRNLWGFELPDPIRLDRDVE